MPKQVSYHAQLEVGGEVLMQIHARTDDDGHLSMEVKADDAVHLQAYLELEFNMAIRHVAAAQMEYAPTPPLSVDINDIPF